MAKARLIFRDVALSTKLSIIKPMTEVLYYRGLPFTDDAGRLTAIPDEYRAILIPRGKNGRQIPLTVIEAAIQELYEVGLIGLCECATNRCMEYEGHSKRQVVRADRTPQIDCLTTPDIQWYDSDIPAHPSRAPAESELELELNRNRKTREASSFVTDFEEWWKGYPSSAGKTNALRFYTSRRHSGQSRDLLLAARDRYIASKNGQTDARYSNGSTFLNPKPPANCNSANIDDFLDGDSIPDPEADAETILRLRQEKGYSE